MRVPDDGSVVDLCSMGRVLRLQPFDKTKGYMQHFNLFALCSGSKSLMNSGPMASNHIDKLIEVIGNLNHNGYDIRNITVKVTDIRFLQELIEAQDLPADEIKRNSLNDDFDLFDRYGIDFPEEVSSSDEIPGDAFTNLGLEDSSQYYTRLIKSFLQDKRDKYPDVDFVLDFNRKSGMGYYKDVCFHIYGETADGDVIQLADGGTVDWLAQLKSDRKYSMVTSGIGAELIQKLFRASQ